MAKIEIHLKSGTVLECRCTSFKTKRNSQNELVGIEHVDLVPHMLYIRLDDISAIIES